MAEVEDQEGMIMKDALIKFWITYPWQSTVIIVAALLLVGWIYYVSKVHGEE